jgi:hypothetical protein
MPHLAAPPYKIRPRAPTYYTASKSVIVSSFHVLSSSPYRIRGHHRPLPAASPNCNAPPPSEATVRIPAPPSSFCCRHGEKKTTEVACAPLSGERTARATARSTMDRLMTVARSTGPVDPVRGIFVLKTIHENQFNP